LLFSRRITQVSVSEFVRNVESYFKLKREMVSTDHRFTTERLTFESQRFCETVTENTHIRYKEILAFESHWGDVGLGHSGKMQGQENALGLSDGERGANRSYSGRRSYNPRAHRGSYAGGLHSSTNKSQAPRGIWSQLQAPPPNPM
jgi:hypothetical protein